MVGLIRLELATSPLSGARSNHLSYRPILPRTLISDAYLVSALLFYFRKGLLVN